jgi:hypothetical protein
VAHSTRELLRRTACAEDEAVASLERLRLRGAAHPLIGVLGGLDTARIEGAVTKQEEGTAAA